MTAFEFLETTRDQKNGKKKIPNKKNFTFRVNFPARGHSLVVLHRR